MARVHRMSRFPCVSSTQTRPLKKAHPLPRVLVAETKTVLDSLAARRQTFPFGRSAGAAGRRAPIRVSLVYFVLGDPANLVAHRGNAPANDSLAFGERQHWLRGEERHHKIKRYFRWGCKRPAGTCCAHQASGPGAGVLDVESSRLTSSDNILIHEVAHLIARFLTSNGKHLVRKARERGAVAVSGIGGEALPRDIGQERSGGHCTARRSRRGIKSMTTTSVSPSPSLSIEQMKETARNMRIDIIKMIGAAGSGHPGGSLSEVELLVALYFSVMRHDPKQAAVGWTATASSSPRAMAAPRFTPCWPSAATSPRRC